jgi:hypothetical protein
VPGATGAGGGGGAAGVAGGGGGGGAAGGGGGGGDGTAVAAGDTSHCVDGFQFDVLITRGPPCQPKFSGDNGGATYQGVTADTVKVIYFESAPNEQVNTILGAKGLAASKEDTDAALKAYTDFLNSHYELWGRKIELEHVVGDCPTTPPDYDKCLAAAQEVVKKKPFAVIWATSLYADVFDVWANAGIVTIGGSSFDISYYNDRRPYRYDVSMDGTQSADMISEYYCTKMAGGHPDHAGAIIHPTIGGRDSVTRKLGVVVPEIRANTLTAQRVIDAVRGCGGPDAAVDHPFTYKSDINSATQQTEATVAALVQQKVTTIVCMCDPIAPVFLTQGLSSQRYFPEHVLPGLGLLDYDLLGQLYDPQQWQHAFGPSQLPAADPRLARRQRPRTRLAGHGQQRPPVRQQRVRHPLGLHELPRLGAPADRTAARPAHLRAGRPRQPPADRRLRPGAALAVGAQRLHRRLRREGGLLGPDGHHPDRRLQGRVRAGER